MTKPQVAILMGSDSDLEIFQESAKVLKDFGVPFEMRVLSAHRTPGPAAEFVAKATQEGVKVFIAGAGGAAHLAGAVAAHTTRPVIGVPMPTPLAGGLDSLLSTVQMPGGVPVATVAVGIAGGKNAGLLAVQILALGDDRLSKALADYKVKMQDEVLAKIGRAHV
jgi:phosphoribosylaminoimidazole carboxylase PurE protein